MEKFKRKNWIRRLSVAFILLLILLNTDSAIQAQTNEYFTFIKRHDYAVVYKVSQESSVTVDTVFSRAMTINGFSCGLIGNNFYTIDMYPSSLSGGVRMVMKHYDILNHKIIFRQEYELRGMNIYDVEFYFRGSELVLKRWDDKLLELKEEYIFMNNENLPKIRDLISVSISKLMSEKIEDENKMR